MKKFVNIILSALAALGMFLIGFFSRQPKINKLRKQIEILQENNSRLLEYEKKLHTDFANLLAQHKALKAYNLKEKTKSKKNLNENLTFQYAMKEYLELLFNRVRTESKMTNDELKFFHAYEKIINGNNLSTRDMVKIKDYINSKYSVEIKQLKEYDCSVAFEKMQEQYVYA